MTDQPKPDQPDGDGLLPCPFCARDVDLINGNGNPATPPRWLVVCEVCGSFHFDDNETDEAVKIRWNTRAPTRDGAERRDIDAVTGTADDRSLYAMLADERQDWRADLHKRGADRDLERRTIELKADAAPPKPAPDAMREALKLIEATCSVRAASIARDALCTDEEAALSTPAPPANAALTDALHALELACIHVRKGREWDKIWRASISLKAALSAPGAAEPGADASTKGDGK